MHIPGLMILPHKRASRTEPINGTRANIKNLIPRGSTMHPNRLKPYPLRGGAHQLAVAVPFAVPGVGQLNVAVPVADRVVGVAEIAVHVVQAVRLRGRELHPELHHGGAAPALFDGPARDQAGEAAGDHGCDGKGELYVGVCQLSV